MSEQLKESLSAVMDGEADEFEIRRVLDETSADPALRGVWERYHLVSSVLKREGRTPARTQLLTARMWAQIDREGANVANEPTDVVSEGSTRAAPRLGLWGQRIAGVAVAAGVAAAIIIGFRPDDGGGVSPAQIAVIAAPAAPAPAALVDTTPSTAVGQTIPTLDVQRAHAYMLHHAHHVALNNRSVVPFVKVAAYESK